MRGAGNQFATTTFLFFGYANERSRPESKDPLLYDVNSIFFFLMIKKKTVTIFSFFEEDLFFVSCPRRITDLKKIGLWKTRFLKDPLVCLV